MQKLKDEAQMPHKSTVLPIYLVATTLRGSHSRENRHTKNYRGGFYINKQGKSLKIYSYCYI